MARKHLAIKTVATLSYEKDEISSYKKLNYKGNYYPMEIKSESIIEDKCKIIIKKEDKEYVILKNPLNDRLILPADSWNYMRKKYKDTFKTITVLPDEILYADFSQIEDGSDFFYNNLKLAYIPPLDTYNATNLSNMFYKCSSLTKLPIVNSRNAINLAGLYSDCSKATEAPYIDLSKCVEGYSLYDSCTNLIKVSKNLDFSNMDSIDWIVANCHNLVEIPDIIDAKNSTSAVGSFESCRNLKEINLVNTENIIYANELFYDCVKLEKINTFNTSKMQNMSNMFDRVLILEEIPFEIDMTSCQSAEWMFSECPKLKNVKLKNVPTTLDLSLNDEGVFEILNYI